MNIDGLIRGTFVKEKANRFLCLVEINGEIQECYIPSSSKLGKHIDLTKNAVLLTQNKSIHTRTRYSLFAVKVRNNYIIVNFNIINDYLMRGIEDKCKGLEDICFSNSMIYKEKLINGYKADIVVDNRDHKVIVEAKGIISTQRDVEFPSVYSERTIKQLLKLKNILKQNYSVYYAFVALSPFVERVNIKQSDKRYYKLLCDCIERGMNILPLTLFYQNGYIILSENESLINIK